MSARTITEVIAELESIIQTARREEDTAGYFAALYQKVTIAVKDRLGTGYFDDDERMEQLDIVFAKRYIDAHIAFQSKIQVTESWEKAFMAEDRFNLIVIQHLLLGMNAHINLDLGIAAAQISTPGSIHSLRGDFNRINELLSSLVQEVQKDLAKIWPFLYRILKWTGKTDDMIVDFSMKLARDGAWKFTNELVIIGDTDQREEMIRQRDRTIADLTGLITDPGKMVKILLWIIRLSEKGLVSEKIDRLRYVV